MTKIKPSKRIGYCNKRNKYMSYRQAKLHRCFLHGHKKEHKCITKKFCPLFMPCPEHEYWKYSYCRLKSIN